MIAIFKKEMRSYFTTSIGYIYLAVSLLLSGFMFGFTTLMQSTSDTSSYFAVTVFLLLVLLPILTMKTFSEEKKTKTEQLLLTSPITLTQMVFGKFLSCFAMFVISNLLTLFYLIPLYDYAVEDFFSKGPNGAMIVGNFIAVLLLGMAFISIGIFVSALTENQFASAIITIGILLFLVLINLLNSFITVSGIRVILDWLSLYSRFQNFSYGLFDFPALIYYLSISAVFLFLTVRVFERRRYA